MCLSNSTIPGLTREQINRAYHGTSFSPEKRAASLIDDYHGELADFRQQVQKHAHSDEQKDLLESLCTSYASGLAKKYCAWINAHGRVLSPMITGPANFPTRRNEKANATERRRLDELMDWNNRQPSIAIKEILGARTPEQVFADEWRILEHKLADDLGVILGVEQGKLHYDKALFKTSMAGRLKRLAKNGEAKLIAKALDFIAHHQKRFKRPVFTPRHSIWKLPQVAEQAQARAAQNAIREDQELGSFASTKSDEPLECKLVAAHADERLRLYFDRKPSAAIRTILKRSGWRWSPQAECWQRKLTQNALYNIRFITRDAGLAKIEQKNL